MVAVAAGSASALFLALLDWATALRTQHSILVAALPVGGLAMGFVLSRWGGPIQRGTNLVIEAALEARPSPLPKRLAPVVLVGTVYSHLLGASAGREGAAVQMGAGLADAIARRFSAPAANSTESRRLRMFLTAGIAAGFGSVFGTPIAGAVFSIEVLTLGRLEFCFLPPSLFAAFVGDATAKQWGTVHSPIPPIATIPFGSFTRMGQLIALGIGFGILAIIYIQTTSALKKIFATVAPSLPVRMAIGGAIVSVGSWLGPGVDYLGLGTHIIARALRGEGIPAYACIAKLVFTAITIASGFLGGEVTPLFFIGATCGNTLAGHLQLPTSVGALCGMAAVLGACANAPLALAIMATELCGIHVLPSVLVATYTAFLVTGHRGIFEAQRAVRTKYGRRLPKDVRLSEVASWECRARSARNGAERSDSTQPQ